MKEGCREMKKAFELSQKDVCRVSCVGLSVVGVSFDQRKMRRFPAKKELRDLSLTSHSLRGFIFHISYDIFNLHLHNIIQ